MAGIQQTVKIVKAFKALAPEVGKPRVLEHALGEMRIIRSGGKAVLCKNGKVIRNLTETEYQLAHEAEIIAEKGGNGIGNVFDGFTEAQYRVNTNNKTVDTLCRTVSGDPTKDLNFYMPMEKGTKKNAILELFGYIKGLGVFIR